MIVKRRTWLYRLTGQAFAQLISFNEPVTAHKAREVLRRSVGEDKATGKESSAAARKPARRATKSSSRSKTSKPASRAARRRA